MRLNEVKADLIQQEVSNLSLETEFSETCKKLDARIKKNGYQIRFPPPYNYLDRELASYNQMEHWLKNYRNWNPPIERIEGRSGDLLLMYMALNNDKL